MKKILLTAALASGILAVAVAFFVVANQNSFWSAKNSPINNDIDGSLGQGPNEYEIPIDTIPPTPDGPYTSIKKSTFAEPVTWQDNGNNYSLVGIDSEKENVILNLQVTPNSSGSIPNSIGYQFDSAQDLLPTKNSLAPDFVAKAGETYSQDVTFPLQPGLKDLNFSTIGKSNKKITVSVAKNGSVKVTAKPNTSQSTISPPPVAPPVVPSQKPPVVAGQNPQIPTPAPAPAPAPTPAPTPAPAPTPSPVPSNPVDHKCPGGGNCIIFNPDPNPTPTPPRSRPTPTPPPAPEFYKWSDPATWGGRMPQDNDDVVIPAGKKVVVDMNPPKLSTVRVEGSLIFEDTRDVDFKAGWIMVSGRMELGTEAKPFTHKATITLMNGAPDAPPAEMRMGEKKMIVKIGTKGIMVVGSGVLELHGTPRVTDWTRLAKTALVGATAIELEGRTDWAVGDRIVIAPTDYNTLQAEDRVITSVNGNVLTLDKPLVYMHWGQPETFGKTDDSEGFTINESAEVGLLTRNVLIQGDEASLTNGFGGHIMVTDMGVAHIENIELTRMGQHKVLGRYPIHFHMGGDMGKGSYVKSNSLHHLFSRCVTIHGTNHLLVKSNVAYDTIGHCFFFEDGAETKNVLENNLGVLIRRPAVADSLIPSDVTSVAASVYWITNPDNTFIGNVAAGSQGSGFWYSLPLNPTGPSFTTSILPRSTPLGKFENNVSHSNATSGVFVDSGPAPDLTIGAVSYNPIDKTSKPVLAKFDNIVTYKNRQNGVWLRGSNMEVSNLMAADNWRGTVSASAGITVRDSYFIGESSNKGTPMTKTEKLGLDGRTLFNPGSPAQRPLGAGFYDGLTNFDNLTFANFNSNSQRGSGAIGYNEFTSFNMSINHVVTGAKFINSNRVSLVKRVAQTAPNNAGEDGYRSAVIYDKDGSISGTPGLYIVPDNSFLTTPACTFTEAWVAWTCPSPYARFQITQNSSDSIAPVTVTRDDGQAHVLWGTPFSPPTTMSTRFITNLIPDKAYTVSIANPVALGRINLSLTESEPGRTLLVSAKYPNGMPIVYRGDFVKAALTRTDDVSKLNGTNYLYSDETGLLTVKLVVPVNKTSDAVDINPSQPIITTMLPARGEVGSVVVIIGSGFTPEDNKIKFGSLGTESDPSYLLKSIDGKTLSFTVPETNYPICIQGTVCASKTSIPQGPHSVSVINRYGTSNFATFTVPDVVAPKVGIDSPKSGATVTGIQSITATASDNVSVTKVEFYVDGALKSTVIKSPYSYSWDTTNGGKHGCAGPHTHTLVTKAYDAAANVTTSAAVIVNMNSPVYCSGSGVSDAVAPTASIASPVAGSIVSGTQIITANATDNVGVSKVEFYIGGVLKSTINTAPYAYSWDTANGGTHPCSGSHSHTLAVKAYDSAGNVTSSANVVVNMNNPPYCPVSIAAAKRIVAAMPNQTESTIRTASAFKADAVYITYRGALQADLTDPNVADTSAIKAAGYKVFWGLDFGTDTTKTFNKDRVIKWFDAAKQAGVVGIGVLYMPAWDYALLTDLVSWMNAEVKNRGMALSYYFGDNLASSTDGIDCKKLMSEAAITHVWIAGGWTKAKRPGCDKAQGSNFWAQMIVWSGGFDSTGRRYYTDAKGIKAYYEWLVGGDQYRDSKGNQMGVGIPNTLFLWGAMNVSGYQLKQSQLNALTEVANMHDSDLAGNVRIRSTDIYPSPEQSPTDQGPSWDQL